MKIYHTSTTISRTTFPTGMMRKHGKLTLEVLVMVDFINTEKVLFGIRIKKSSTLLKSQLVYSNVVVR